MTQLLPIFLTVFLAELGDKTQLATVLFASDKSAHPIGIFMASAGALVLSSAIAVFLGTFASRYLEMLPLKLFAGAGFILIGIWTLLGHFQEG